MYSRNHAILSAVTGAALLAVTSPRVHPVLVVAVAVVVGVGIDFDHFLVAYLNTGSTENIRRLLRNPLAAVTDQDSLFGETDLSHVQRLFSHVVIAGVAVGALWVLSAPYWALVVGLTLYVHVLADLYADVKHYGQTADATQRRTES
ncbi:hypothetical protein KTS45_06995 [Halomicroarcula limicola]|uniref:Uncharacterized protein n=1 Tax=Haloarcula limicola TaxID=1429915 RepID=A0A8J7Y4N9_9EURY|nr:hypothetical protein [Halomicroarcula limicola]MBV0923947.1 hypothetical protein [Halomicroarcula limicola]